MLRQHAAGEFFDLAECDGFKSACALKAQAKAANSAKQIEYTQLFHWPALSAFAAISAALSGAFGSGGATLIPQPPSFSRA
jgi:hypothetical protein